MGNTSRAETVTSGQSVPQTAGDQGVLQGALGQACRDLGDVTRAAAPDAILRPPTPVGGATGDDRAVA
jgi:hypothetical protein